jgi:hypothetical protein
VSAPTDWALTVPGYGWQHLPAAAKETRYVGALVRYGLSVWAVWCKRGDADARATTSIADLAGLTGIPAICTLGELDAADKTPPRLGEAKFQRSQPAAPVREDPTRYPPCFSDVPDDLPVVWPTPERARRRSSSR